MNSRVLLVVIALVALTVGSMWPVTNAELINFDDDIYITNNPNVSAGLSVKGVSWAFTSFGYAGNWHPMTWLSHMLDVELFGQDPEWHHLINLIFHIANTILLFLILRAMTGALWPSALVTALFGVHPLHVESVAWVAERKDVLSAFFFISTLGIYLWYVRRPGIGRYLLLSGMFILGLLSKPMVVTLPFVLLLLDYWPLSRSSKHEPTNHTTLQRGYSWGWLILEKVPLFVPAAISSIITYKVQAKAGAMSMATVYSWPFLAANAIISYVKYIMKLVWPSNLAIYYPLPYENFPWWQTIAAGLFLFGISIVIFQRGRRRRYLTVGWLWFLGTLIPVIGFVRAGWQSMADRYMYLPSIGLFILLVWGICDLTSGRKILRQAAVTVFGIVLITFSAVSFRQAQFWKDGITIFRHALAVTQNNWMAHLNLGNALLQQGMLDEAIDQYKKELLLKPRDTEAYNNLGTAYAKKGDFKSAEGFYAKAIELLPDMAEFHNNLGAVLSMQSRFEESLTYFTAALRLKPDYASAHFNLGASLDKLGRTNEAIEHYAEALRLQPADEQARSLYEKALQRMKKGSGEK